jgi:hypothetical protein
LQSPLIATRTVLKAGGELSEALSAGLARLLRGVGLDVDQAGRFALLDTIERDPRFTGWTRAISGTCGACIAASGNHANFEVHPNCQCVPEPRVANVPDRFPRLTGKPLFDAMSSEHQNDALGPEAADLLRNGEIALADLVTRSPMATEDDYLTQTPAKRL